jgi:predicted metal-dependent hydrolase
MATAQIEMTVRRPSFDYASTPRNWMPANPAFGYQLNGGSLTLPYLEPYLIRVMRQAKEVLGDRCPGLHEDIKLFNGQEANHFKIHSQFNALLRERYIGIEELEAEIEADFARMLREESLEFNLGYSAGFETTGMVASQLFFHDVAESRVGADAAVEGLWGWHLAEEYEHRCVAFDVFQALSGSYRQRLRLFFFQANHLNTFGTKAARLMRLQDEAAGHLLISPEERASHDKLERKQMRCARRRIASALLPWHDPRRHGALSSADQFLAKLDYA